MYGIYANIWGILMVNVTIYSIHRSYGWKIPNPPGNLRLRARPLDAVDSVDLRPPAARPRGVAETQPALRGSARGGTTRAMLRWSDGKHRLSRGAKIKNEVMGVPGHGHVFSHLKRFFSGENMDSNGHWIEEHEVKNLGECYRMFMKVMEERMTSYWNHGGLGIPHDLRSPQWATQGCSVGFVWQKDIPAI